MQQSLCADTSKYLLTEFDITSHVLSSVKEFTPYWATTNFTFCLTGFWPNIGEGESNWNPFSMILISHLLQVSGKGTLQLIALWHPLFASSPHENSGFKSSHVCRSAGQSSIIYNPTYSFDLRRFQIKIIPASFVNCQYIHHLGYSFGTSRGYKFNACENILVIPKCTGEERDLIYIGIVQISWYDLMLV